MMYVFRILLLIALAPLVLAEPDKTGNAVYSANSQLTVDNINKAAGILRDPTQMSLNFRQAIKNIAPQAQANSPAAGLGAGSKALPVVELAGKVLSPNQPPAVVLYINNRPVHLPKGGSTTTINGDQVLTVRVDEISEKHVKVMLVEMNKLLILQ